MTLFDWTQYLPESLKTKYEVAGVPQTIIEKVLQLLVQVLSGNAGTTADFESKLYELKYFWDAYGTQDLSKLKTLLDSNGITTKVAYINEICGTSTPADSEKAYLATVQAVGKMKGTLKGVQNILRLFGITVSIVPWYDPLYPDPEAEECNVIITASLDSGCLAEGSYSTVEDIIKLLLDVCAIIKRFDLVKRFTTQLPFNESLITREIEQYICDYYDWRTSRDCCDVYCIGSKMPAAFYTGQIICTGDFIHNGVYSSQCTADLECTLDRIDIDIVDPIIRASAELEVKDIIFQSVHTVRFTFDYAVDFGQGCGYGVVVGDAIIVNDALDPVNNKHFNITAFDNTDKWIEVFNIDVSDHSHDELGSIAVMAINLAAHTNRYITGYESPVRIPLYDYGFIPVAGDFSEANWLIGTKWIRGGDYRECPDIFLGLYSIKNVGVQWTLYENDSIGDEYYLEKAGSGDPLILAEPNILTVDEVEYTKGTAGLLSPGEWDYFTDSIIGFPTIALKLNDGTDPSLKADNTIEAGAKKDYCVDTLITHAPESMWSGPIPYLS